MINGRNTNQRSSALTKNKRIRTHPTNLFLFGPAGDSPPGGVYSRLGHCLSAGLFPVGGRGTNLPDSARKSLAPTVMKFAKDHLSGHASHWARIWHAKLASFHKIPQKKRWVYGRGEVIAFLIHHRNAGAPGSCADEVPYVPDPYSQAYPQLKSDPSARLPLAEAYSLSQRTLSPIDCRLLVGHWHCG